MLSTKETIKFQSYLSQALLNHVRTIVIEYIDDTPYLLEDITDKGWEEVIESYMAAADGLSFTY